MIDTIKTINKNISSDRLLDYVSGIIRHHRIQASPGYRDAANYANERLKENGVCSQIVSFPADYGINYLGAEAFQEWSCKSAVLKLVEPEEMIIADFSACPTSLIQKSFACDYSCDPLEIVLLDKGSDEHNYENIDIRGKLIFIRDNFNPYLEWAINKLGAVGIITDYVVEAENARSRHDMYYVSRYCSFWWHEDQEIKPFGFTISPAEGDRLAKLCKEKPCKAAVKIESEFYPGYYEDVVAEIKGETDEEVWITAHLCHPKTSANDNASGCAAAIEAISVIQKLINENVLPPLKRTLKIILLPEFAGTYPYLAANPKHKCIAAINLDMVGGKQELGYGPLTITSTPYASASFVSELLSVILNELKKDTASLSPDTFVPLFNSVKCNFSGGSDHLILSDPLIGIPTPMLGQWPDIFYHTSGDTLDVISPTLIKKSASLAAAYVYLLCNMTAETETAVLHESFLAFNSACVSAIGETSEISLKTRLGFICEHYCAGVQKLSRSDTLIPSYIELFEALRDKLTEIHCSNKQEINSIADLNIPKRTVGAVVYNPALFAKSASQKEALKTYRDDSAKKLKSSDVSELCAQYYMDGNRTISEIALRSVFEGKGGSIEALIKYIYLLRELGICEF